MNMICRSRAASALANVLGRELEVKYVPGAYARFSGAAIPVMAD